MPKGGGVYVAFTEKGGTRPTYIGEAVTFANRIAGHGEQRVSRWREILFLPMQGDMDRKATERLMIRSMAPCENVRRYTRHHSARKAAEYLLQRSMHIKPSATGYLFFALISAEMGTCPLSPGSVADAHQRAWEQSSDWLVPIPVAAESIGASERLIRLRAALGEIPVFYSPNGAMFVDQMDIRRGSETSA